jgi:peptide deformylase
MAVLKVRRYGDPVLRRRAAPVESVTPEIRRLAADMVDTMYDEVGIGLTAPQVGISMRLSLPGIFAHVTRSEWVTLQAQDLEGQPVAMTARGLRARVFQHELDHLDGVLFIDRLEPVLRDRIKRRIKKEGFTEDSAHRAFAL